MSEPISIRTNEYIFGVRRMIVFDSGNCEKIVSSAPSTGWTSGAHQATSSRDDSGYRRVQSQTVPCTADSWPLNRILESVLELNAASYQFEMSGFLLDKDFPTLLRYDASDRGHYDWHVDYCGGFSTRKLSFSIQLSDPSSYDGGDLEFAPPNTMSFGPDATYESVRKTIRMQGGMVIFPSYMLHRVTPVTRGTRYAIVGWVHGPAFR